MSSSGKSPFEISKTIVGVENELCAISPIAQTERPTTTLNYKYSINQDSSPTSKPVIAFFGIGIGGSRNVDDANLRTPNIPLMTNMDLYNPIPIRCVPVDEDLSELERAMYRLRRRIDINGSEFWAYYLKKVTFTDTAIQITRTDPVTQEESPFDLDPSNLTPTPPIPTDSGIVTPTGSEINVILNGEIEIHGTEVMEYINARYADPRRAIIDEIGIYTGEDRMVTGDDGSGGSIQYTESIYTQLAIHYCDNGMNLAAPAAVGRRALKLGKGNLFLL